MLRFVLVAYLLRTTVGFNDPHFETGRYGIVHLFEWHWDTIANECEAFLGPQKVGAVQISPPAENRIVEGRPWYERYQPVSYVLRTRSGDRHALIDMVNRCNAVGVRIYADIVINHMCKGNGKGYGTGGSYFNGIEESFPAVPYGRPDFNDANCHSADGNIDNYLDVNQVRNCRLENLVDLNQGTEYVRSKVVDMMNDLISIGVAGFRVDACKHMWPGDLKIIYNKVNRLNSTIYGTNKQPYIYQEVIDLGGEPIKSTDYSGLASVTEFRYGKDLAENRNKLKYLGTLGESWSLLPSDKALVFINNHDNQRGHGGGGAVVDFLNNPYDLKILTAYMLAYPYGTPRVMSSYYFTNNAAGPPPLQRVVESDGSCGNGWACEHRWRQIANMFEFGAVVSGTKVENWWSNSNGRFAFSRGNKGFIAANKDGMMSEQLYTGLPDGSYCNIISGYYKDGSCSGNCIVVSNGMAPITINSAMDQDQVVAIHVKAMTTNCAS